MRKTNIRVQPALTRNLAVGRRRPGSCQFVNLSQELILSRRRRKNLPQFSSSLVTRARETTSHTVQTRSIRLARRRKCLSCSSWTLLSEAVVSGQRSKSSVSAQASWGQRSKVRGRGQRRVKGRVSEVKIRVCARCIGRVKVKGIVPVMVISKDKAQSHIHSHVMATAKSKSQS